MTAEQKGHVVKIYLENKSKIDVTMTFGEWKLKGRRLPARTAPFGGQCFTQVEHSLCFSDPNSELGDGKSHQFFLEPSSCHFFI
jgi:hypothetical protein